MQSLSASHTLAANVSSAQDPDGVKLPPELQSKLDTFRRAREAATGQNRGDREENVDKPADVTSPDIILNAVTVCTIL